MKLPRDPVGDPRDVIGLRALLVLRRHVAGVDAVHDFLPVPHRLRRIKINRQRVHAQVALLLFLAVALVAVLCEKWAHEFFAPRQRSRGVRRFRDASGKKCQQERYSEIETGMNAKLEHELTNTRWSSFLSAEC